MKTLFRPEATSPRVSLGLLSLRLFVGVALMHHGWPKAQDPFGWMGPDATVPGVLQALAALSELGGGLALVLGLLTPLAMLGVLATMGYATFLHIAGGDPFVGQGASWSPAGLYFTLALAFLLCGPGRFSLDAWLFGARPRLQAHVPGARAVA